MVNIITMVSVSGVLFGTMAMVIVLSVFNGFDNIIHSLYQKVDADFKVELKTGKLFDVDNDFISGINNIDGVIFCSEILEQKLLAQYLDYQYVVEAKGVDENYIQVSNLNQNIVLGNYLDGTKNFVIVGNKVFNRLALRLLDFENSLKLSFFKEAKMMDINSSMQTQSFYATGVFRTDVEIDETHLVLSIHDLRNFLKISRQCSSIEIKTDDKVNLRDIHASLISFLGPDYVIKNRIEQRPFVYKMVRTEKIAVYMIFSFILIISMLSLIASLIVLLMEKQKDIELLHSLGLNRKKIKYIFLLIGCSITIIGGVLGTFLGVFICFLQAQFKLIHLNTEIGLISAYPIKVNVVDILIIQIIVLFLGIVTSFLVSKNNNFYLGH